MSKIKCGSRSAGKSEKDFDPYWLDIGEQIEYEHTCDKKEARRIAMDHLSEFKDYYKELQKMERRLELKQERSKNKIKHKSTPKPKQFKSVGTNLDNVIKSTNASRRKILNNLKNNFKYKEV